MSHTLEIEKPDEIRCPYCLSWNNKNDTICSECTTKLYDTYNFGAARALFSWENSDPSRLPYTFASESKEKINHWNAIFQVQFDFFRKEFSNYTFLFKYAVLDIQEEVYKYFLSGLPMRPEVFKEFKEYDFPENGKNETELLSFMFRTHPASVVKAMAGVSLIHKGKADIKVLQFLDTWNAHYKKLHREKLLSYAHWSIQKLNTSQKYAPYANEVVPLMDGENVAASWAKIFLYKADYEVQELRFALDDIIASGNTHVAISACYALRKYDRIKDVLLQELDESTVDLAFTHSDERHIPGLLLFLRHAPRKYHDPIIRRCVQLKPQNETVRTQITEWLLQQDDNVLLEVLFAWSEIPRLEEVLEKLLINEEGMQALVNFLPAWMKEHQVRIIENKALELPLEREARDLSPKAEQTLLSLKDRVKGVDFELLCEKLRKKNEVNALTEVFSLLFLKDNICLTERQTHDGFYALTRAAENSKATDKPYFIFRAGWGMNIDLSGNDFHRLLQDYLTNDETRRLVSGWLASVYEILASARPLPEVDSEVFGTHADFMLREIEAQHLDANTSGRFLKLILKLKGTFALNETQLEQLRMIASVSNDFEVKYWVEQIMG